MLPMVTAEFDAVVRAVGVTAERGPAGSALATLVRDAVVEEEAQAARTGRPALSRRRVALGVMKNLRAAMTELRDELDAAEGLGRYR